MITYRIHLIRSGNATPPGVVHLGRLDPPLTPEGVEELEYLRRELDYPRVERVYVSPLSRCVQTADLLYPETYTQTEERLMDMDLGDFQGKSAEELAALPAYAAWLENSARNPPTGGEGAQDFQRRVVGALAGVFATMMEERSRSAAMITHGGVIMALLAAVGLPRQSPHVWRTRHGAGFTLLLTPQQWMRDGGVEVFAAIPSPREELW